jgi:hypothetical protein
MKISNPWSIVAFLGLSLGAAGVDAQSGRDAEVLVPLARGVAFVPAPGDAVPEGAVIEELPAVVAPHWSAADEPLANGLAHEAYWLGLFAFCVGAAGAITLRRRAPEPEPRLSFPPTAREGRISLV